MTVGCIDLSGISGLGEVFEAIDPGLVGISVWPVQDTTWTDGVVVAVGDTLRVGAWGQVGGPLGAVAYDRVLDAAWSTSSRAIATVEPRLPPPGDSTSTAGAVVRGVRAGVVQVRATARGVSGELQVRVVDRSAAP